MSDEKTPDLASDDALEPDAKRDEAGVHKKADAPVEQAVGQPPVSDDVETGGGDADTATPDFPAQAQTKPLPLNAVLAELAQRFDEIAVEERPGQDTIRVPREQWLSVAKACKEAGYDMFIDLCGVDYLRRDPRFEVVAILVSTARSHRIRLLTGVPSFDPQVDSIASVYAGANFYERETYDLFGIHFAGHPDLTRILLPDDWEGHPLRKDFSVGSVPVQFKESHQAR